jgi:hypothetical protein
LADHRGGRTSVGELLAAAATIDAIDASVALLAKVDDRLYTSDPGDLRKLCGAAGIKGW